MKWIFCSRIGGSLSYQKKICIVYAIFLYTIISYAQGNAGYIAADESMTNETRMLLTRLRALPPRTFFFGQQDALAYCVHWKGDEMRTDISDVCGRFPSVFGWEISKYEQNHSSNIDGVPFELIKKGIVLAYELGGINTVSWHVDNPVSGGSAWDTTIAVSKIIPGGSGNKKLNSFLDRVALFFSTIKTKEGTLVPVIFRLWHENDGNWFWWGKDYCHPDEYRTLWQYTVHYLRDIKNVHNLLYAYSWSELTDDSAYDEYYPGNNWVDIIGADLYGDIDEQKNIATLVFLNKEGLKNNKITALTEAGSKLLKSPNWFTRHLLYPIVDTPYACDTKYVMIWRNAGEGSYYGAYAGSRASDDFMKFTQSPSVILLPFSDTITLY